MNVLMTILAQGPQTGAPTGQSQGPGPQIMFFGLILFMAVFYIMMFRGRNKERKKFEEMLASLKRNDRVQTIGGIYGTVVDVRETEVVLKVDETNNVKMRFERGAIKAVIRETEEAS